MSDIFNEYVKIMTDKGFVKKADVMTQEDKESDKEYAENIKALYGIDIKTNNSNKDLVEQAHPEKVIIAPSYDRLNGLVENINERHDIMVGIVNKSIKGMHTQHRYAKEELLNELVRLGFQLDNEGEEELSKMADVCANNLVKEAVWPVALLWTARILAGVVTAGWLKSKVIGHISQGVKPDTEKAITALQELRQTVSPSSYGIIDKWIKALNMLLQNATRAEQIAGNSENQDIGMELDQSKVNATKEDLAYLGDFKKMAEYVATRIDTFIGQIGEMQEGGEAESEWWQAAEWAWESVAGNEKTNAVNSLAALRNSLQAFVSKLMESSAQSRTVAEQKQEDIFSMLQEKGKGISDYVKGE